MQSDVLDTLFSARNDIGDMIIAATPADAAHKQQLDRLMQRRDHLTAAIQLVISAQFKKMDSEVQGAIAKLDESTAKLAAVSATLDRINDAIALADQIVQLASQIVSLAA
jgi:hypothetical protein